MAGSPARRPSASLSLALVPLTVSTPCLSFGSLNLAALGGYEALAPSIAGAAFTCPTTIPAAPATAAVTATAQVASHTRRVLRDSLSRMSFFICARLLSMSRERLGDSLVFGDGGGGGRA